MDAVTQRPWVWQRRWLYLDKRAPSRNCMVLCQILLLAGLLCSGPTQANAGDPGVPSHPTPSPVSDAGRGEMLYKASCMVCHGPEAAGALGPRLAGNPILSNDKAFKEIIRQGRHMMPPLQDMLTGQQLADIHAWLQTLH
jgi:mono/diheme cytochrome c family protein